MIIGIDPGLTGAIAYFNDTIDFPQRLEDIPTEAFGNGKVKRRVDPYVLTKLLFNLAPSTTVYLEVVSSMPGQGVASMFSMGNTYGCIRGVVGAFGHKLVEVRPQAWKKHFNLDREKDSARLLAIELFPDFAEELKRKKDHNRAEALLIAKYGYDMENMK